MICSFLFKTSPYVDDMLNHKKNILYICMSQNFKANDFVEQEENEEVELPTKTGHSRNHC